jgi:outer membrane receptor protein involved in Fe transport
MTNRMPKKKEPFAMIPAIANHARAFIAAIVLAAVAVVPALADPTPTPAATPQGIATITGVVADQNGSLPVAGAHLALQQGTTTVSTAVTDLAGNFTFSNVAPGTYSILVSALGYEVSRTTDISVTTGTTTIGLIVRRATTTSTKELGHVIVTSKAAALQTTTTIQQSADVQVMQKTNQIRLAEGLGKLPGVNYIGLDSAVGDDIAIDIRGLKPSETQVLLDGHPIGPLGVSPGDIGGGTGGYDFQDGPLFAIGNTVVTYGSGAVGLYGVDAVGGSVDLQTLNPTVTPQTKVQYGFGDQGKQLFDAQMTGTEGRFAYAILHGVVGTYGDFPTQDIAQTGARGNDFTTQTLNNVTYPVSGNYDLRNDLAKLRFDFSPKSSLSFTAYSATSWDDKSGEGDNDFITYDYALYQAQHNSNCTTTGGGPGVTVKTNAGSECYTPQQYAANASGPAGGGPEPWQALRSQDYHARYLMTVGKNQIVVDGFDDNYGQDRQRPQSFINGPLSVLTNVYNSYGLLVSDDIASQSNDVGFGLYSQRQYINGDSISSGAFLVHPALFLKLNSFFVRDAFTPSDQLSYFVNMWVKNSLIGGNSVDPRLSVVYRPTSSDVFRVTGGESSADPAPIALSLTGPGGINPGNCQTFGIGNAPSPGELPEKAGDFEVSAAHRWIGDTISQLVLYDTNETNTIFAGAAPAADFLGQIGEYGPDYLPAVYSRIESSCPNFAPPNPAPTINDLTIATNLNLAKSRARGIELSQRYRATENLVFGGYYDTQSTVIFDAPVFLLVANPTLINGSQLPKIPLHKYGLTADLTSTRGGELYLDYTHYDGNNPLNRPAYGVADASLTQQLSTRFSANLGVSNLFDSDVDDYGRIGWGVFIPENQYGHDSSGLQQGSERFGLSPRALSLTLSVNY